MGLKLFLAFVFFPVSCLIAQEHDQSDSVSCPKYFQCGNLGRLRFPFANFSQPDCGLCPVRCNNSTYSKIQLDRSSDQIFDAVRMMNNSIIKLRDLQLQRLLKEQSCNILYYQIYLPNTSSVSFKISSNTSTLFRCSSSPYFSQEVIDQLNSDGYRNYTNCDGFQIFYRSPKYFPSQPGRTPPGCMAIHLPMRPWSNISKESELFDILSFEFDLEWQLNPKDKSKIIILTAAGRFSKMVFRMNLGFFLSFLLLFHLLPPRLGQKYPYSACPQNFSCQNFPSEFPFNPSQPQSCGLCMAICDTDTHSLPKIKLAPLSEKWFDVVKVLENSVIKLRDPMLQNLLLSHNCSSFFYNMKIPNLDSISYIVSNFTLIFKCLKNPDHSQERDARFRFHRYSKTEPCEDFDIYYGVPKSYVAQNPSDPLPSGCSPAGHLPMLSMDKVSDDRDLFNLLTAEFDLQLGGCNELCHHKEMEEHVCHIEGQGMNKLSIILRIAAPTCGTVALLVLIFCFRRKLPFCNSLDLWKAKKEHHNVETFLKKCGSIAPKRYHYSDVKKMTHSFEIKLGQGGYGSVYKGKLQDGSLVAVKILKESKGNGEEFINEVASISRTSHVNIVTLLGFCFQGNKKALIYEFLANGSLDKFIYGEKSLVNRQLDWSTLYKIALGIARGLEYLHRGCNTRILHFDIKPHNILLDEDFCPKISDFGLAKLFPAKESILSLLTARGTIGYIALEVVCRNIGAVSHKSDVYRYGMMVLEMVGGRKNVDAGVDHTSEIYLPHWIYTRLDKGQELGLSGIMNEEENKQARKMLIVSLWCIQTHPSSRPKINNVLEMLEGPLEALQMPPQPFFSSPSRASPDDQSTILIT